MLEQQLVKGIELLPRYAESLQDKLAPFIDKVSGFDKAKADELIQSAVGQLGSLPLRIVQAYVRARIGDRFPKHRGRIQKRHPQNGNTKSARTKKQTSRHKGKSR